MRRGPALMALAGLFFAGMLACVKQVRPSLAAFDVIFWRSAIALPFLWLTVARGHSFSAVNWRGIGLRGLLGFGAMAGYYTAMRGMDIAEVTLIGKMQPLVVAALAGALLGHSERTNPTTWFALVVGFCGCLILLAPNVQSGSMWGLFALAGAISSAGAHLTLRVLGRTDSPRVVVFYFYLASVPLAAAAVFLTRGTLPDLPNGDAWLPLAGVAALSVISQWLVTEAYRSDTASVVAAAGYSAAVWAIVFDYAIFSILPKSATVVGGILIVVSGLLLVFKRTERGAG